MAHDKIPSGQILTSSFNDSPRSINVTPYHERTPYSGKPYHERGPKQVRFDAVMPSTSHSYSNETSEPRPYRCRRAHGPRKMGDNVSGHERGLVNAKAKINSSRRDINTPTRSREQEAGSITPETGSVSQYGEGEVDLGSNWVR